jgi:hypothetical protein
MKNSKLNLQFVALILGMLTLFSFNAESANTLSSDENHLFQKDKASIVYIVDGQEMTSKEVDKLDAADIEKMEFVTDETKKKLYTDKDVETVVLITLKKGEEEAENIEE